jgi:hypothetical protein
LLAFKGFIYLKSIDIVPAIMNFIAKLEDSEEREKGTAQALGKGMEEYHDLMTEDQYASHIKF